MSIQCDRRSLHYMLSIDSPDLEKDIWKPLNYVRTNPGKLIRENMIEILTQWIPVPQDFVDRCKADTSLLHNISLIIDDIQDRSILRRGCPAAHVVYGIPRCILMTDFCLFQNRELLFGKNRKFDVFRQLWAGQGMDVYWRENCICPTEEEYYLMVYRKTALTFITFGKILQGACIKDWKNTDQFLKIVGIFFQIKDDYLNLKSEIYFKNKGFCEDISEGKFSFPIIHAVNNFPDKAEEIIEILRERTTDVQKIKKCLSILEDCGSLEYTKRRIDEIELLLTEEKQKLGYNPLMEELIKTALFTYH